MADQNTTSTSVLSKITSNWKLIIILISVMCVTHSAAFFGGCGIGQKRCAKATDGVQVDPTPSNEVPPIKFEDAKKKGYVVDKKAKLSADQVAKLYADYNKAPLVFSHESKGSDLYVKVIDTFPNEKGKVKTATMKYHVTPAVFHHTLGFAPGILFVYNSSTSKFLFMYGGELSYVYRWGMFGIGAGVPIYGNASRDIAGGANIKFEFSW